MKLSWKTSLCGIVGVVLIGSVATPGIPVWLAHILQLLGAAAPSVGLLFARDNNRTSEEVGVKTTVSVIPKPNS